MRPHDGSTPSGADASGDPRMRALGKLHEASAILLAAGDVAGMRAVHAAMGVLLEVAGGGSQATNEREMAEIGTRVRRAG